LRICDLALYSPSTSSGVRTYIESKVAYVNRRRDLDHVVIVPGVRDTTRLEQRSKIIVVRGVPSPYPGIRIAMNVFRIAAIIAREHPDVIELNCQYTLPWAAFLATRVTRTPIVGIYHTDVPACARHWARHAGRGVASTVERVIEWYEGMIYRHCTQTIILNEGMRDRLARLGVRRVRALPCGVDPVTFHPGRRDDRFRTALGIRADQTVLFYAGRLSAEKELDVLFAAHERLPRGTFVLVIAGDGPDASAVRRYAAQRVNDVRYIGHLASRDELAVAYASSDVFVMPGRYETFGMATLEAICSGPPVVGIRGSGTAAIVPPHIGVLAGAGDAGDLAAAIRSVAAWPAEATRAACHAFAAARFSWDVVFDQYVDMYRDLIRETAVAAPQPA